MISVDFGKKIWHTLCVTDMVGSRKALGSAATAAIPSVDVKCRPATIGTEADLESGRESEKAPGITLPIECPDDCPGVEGNFSADYKRGSRRRILPEGLRT